MNRERFFFLFGSQRRWSLSLPVLTLIFPALLPCLVRDSLCTALQTKILWINWSLNAIDTIETWVSGNLTALTERSQPAIRWCVGEVANRVSGGSFRGGRFRLCPGLSKNSENGNSCPKPHKAARMIEAVGRAVSIETETLIAIWILPRRSSRLYKGKLIKMETKMDKMDPAKACKNWNVYSPQRQNNLIFFWLPYSGLGKAVAGIYPGRAMQ